MQSAVLFMPGQHPVTPASSTFEDKPRLQQLHDARSVGDGEQVQEAEAARRARELVAHAAHLAHRHVRRRHRQQHVLAAQERTGVGLGKSSSATQSGKNQDIDNDTDSDTRLSEGACAAGIFACSGNTTDLNVLNVYIRREGT